MLRRILSVKTLRHYTPLLATVAIVAVGWLVQLINRLGHVELHANMFAEIVLALMAFWVWAYTTNVHSRCSVRSSGEQKFPLTRKGDEDRRNEATVIFWCSFLTAMLYMVCWVPGTAWDYCRWVGLVPCTLLPCAALKLPP